MLMSVNWFGHSKLQFVIGTIELSFQRDNSPCTVSSFFFMVQSRTLYPADETWNHVAFESLKDASISLRCLSLCEAVMLSCDLLSASRWQSMKKTKICWIFALYLKASCVKAGQKCGPRQIEVNSISMQSYIYMAYLHERINVITHSIYSLWGGAIMQSPCPPDAIISYSTDYFDTGLDSRSHGIHTLRKVSFWTVLWLSLKQMASADQRDSLVSMKSAIPLIPHPNNASSTAIHSHSA